MLVDPTTLGVAECVDCESSCLCCLRVWGDPDEWSRCKVCGGQVWWTPVDDEVT